MADVSACMLLRSALGSIVFLRRLPRQCAGKLYDGSPRLFGLLIFGPGLKSSISAKTSARHGILPFTSVQQSCEPMTVHTKVTRENRKP